MTPDTLSKAAVTVSESWRTGVLRNPDYYYSTKPRGESWLDELWMWFMRWVSEVFDVSYDGAGDIIGYPIVAVVLTLAVLFFVRSRKQGMFESKGRKLGTVEEAELEPTEDIDRLIDTAVANGEFRQAVRLQYRRTLAELRDRNVVVYRPEKTDSEYLHELRSQSYYQAMRDAVSLFQVAWYALESITEDQYRTAEQAFSIVRSQMQHTA